jgi:hypothetical protein
VFYLFDCTTRGVDTFEGCSCFDNAGPGRSPHGTSGAIVNKVISESAFESPLFALLVCLFVFFMVLSALLKKVSLNVIIHYQ